jgi:phenylacetate-CoA ligase
MLTPYFRENIENAFKCKVFNDYGLNDGGISAGDDLNGHMRIHTERAIMEVVDDNNNSVLNKSGRIIATSLYNFDFPFIRYDTCDLGVITDKFSRESDQRLVLEKLEGRTTDYIVINGKTIGSPVLTVLMSKIDAKRYQFIQKNKDSLELRIEKETNYSEDQELFISNSLKSNLGDEFDLVIKYTSDFYETNNKFKFIIRDF